MGAPALIDAQSAQVLSLLNAVRAWLYNRAEGAIVSDNGTAIAASVATLTIDHTAGIFVGGGSTSEAPAQTAVALSETLTFTATSGKSAIAAVVADFSGAIAVKASWGAEADTGSEASPTDAEITADLGHSEWARLADVTVEITGAAAGNFTVDNTARNIPAVFGTDLAVDEASFSTGGPVIPPNRS